MKRPPGPRGPAAIAALARIVRGNLPEFFGDLARRYGPVSSLRLGMQQIVFIDDPALIEEILVTRQHAFVRDFGAAVLRELVGEGLITTEDPAHLARRRLMAPAFHRARVATYADAIVREADRVTDAWAGAGAVDVGAAMTALTLGAVGEALFGADLRGSAASIADVLTRVVRRGRLLGPLLLLGLPLLSRLRGETGSGPSRLFPSERADLERVVEPLIERRRADGAGEDLLSLLLAARDEMGAPLDEAALRNEVVTLVLAGHETTANALTWAFYLLARHPSVERKLHAEVDEVLAGRAPRVEDVAKLRYTANVFTETLRLFPSAPAFARRPIAPIELGGYTFARGTSIYVSPYVTQRNSRFYAEPEAFMPERWDGPAPARFAYFPFGGGSKMCIGEPFARLEGVLALAAVARRYALRATDAMPVTPQLQTTLRPQRPVIVAPLARRATRYS